MREGSVGVLLPLVGSSGVAGAGRLRVCRDMGDAAEEVFWKLHPGSKVVVFYTDDDVWHERYVLLPGQRPEVYWVLTPMTTSTRRTCKGALRTVRRKSGWCRQASAR